MLYQTESYFRFALLTFLCNITRHKHFYFHVKMPTHIKSQKSTFIQGIINLVQHIVTWFWTLIQVICLFNICDIIYKSLHYVLERKTATSIKLLHHSIFFDSSLIKKIVVKTILRYKTWLTLKYFNDVHLWFDLLQEFNCQFR